MSKASEVKAFRDFEKSAGVENGPPLGNHPSMIERAEVRDNADSGIPELFILFRVEDGEAANRTIPLTLRWYASTTDYKTGMERTESEQKRSDGFVRSNPVALLKAVLGTDMGDWGDLELPLTDDEHDDIGFVRSCMEEWATVLKGSPVSITVSESGDFTNYRFAQRTDIRDFSLNGGSEVASVS